MPLNGSGVWTPPSPEFPAVGGADILASDFNTIINDIKVVFGNTLFRDGQGTAAGNLPLGGYKLTGLAVGSATEDSVQYGQYTTALALKADSSAVSTAVDTLETSIALKGDKSGKLSQFAATSSAELRGVLSDETGTGAAVFANTPTLVSPVLGVATGTSFNSITALASSVSPMDGVAAVGTSTTVARQDHKHASDTSKADLVSPTFTGTLTAAAVEVTSLESSGAVTLTGGNLVLTGATVDIIKDGVQILSSQRTGWETNTGTQNRGAFDTETVALNTLARHLHALILDLKAHGIIGE